MTIRSAAVAGVQAAARGLPDFRGKSRLFRTLYRACGVGPDDEFRLPMRGTATRVHLRLGSLIESAVLTLGEYAPEVSRLIDRVVRPGWTCLDVGANVGLVTVRLAERVGPAGRVLAVEPNPALMPRLAANTADLPNVVRAGVAVAAEPGDGYLAVNDPTTCANHNATMVGAAPESGAIRVPISTLDRLWADHLDRAPVRFIKLDIEGYEFNALRGGAELIAAGRPAILMEFNRPYATAMGYTLDGVLDFLRGLGPYRLSGVGAGGRLVPPDPTPEVFDVLFHTD
jgi:FkbM family methyltransferase